MFRCRKGRRSGSDGLFFCRHACVPGESLPDRARAESAQTSAVILPRFRRLPARTCLAPTGFRLRALRKNSAYVLYYLTIMAKHCIILLRGRLFRHSGICHQTHVTEGIMNNISRCHFLTLGCCAAGVSFFPSLVSPAQAATLSTAEVNRLFQKPGAEKKAQSAGRMDS